MTAPLPIADLPSDGRPSHGEPVAARSRANISERTGPDAGPDRYGWFTEGPLAQATLPPTWELISGRLVGAQRYLVAMDWYARPEGTAYKLRLPPQLDCWNGADDPEQLRLQAYLDDTEDLLASSRVDGPWALRLDVGLPAALDLLRDRDLDNYAYPLAYRLRDRGLVSVWCTKQHSERSFVAIEAARKVSRPSGKILIAQPHASASSVDYKEQVRAAVAKAPELPPGPVTLELSFIVGASRNWLKLWKQTIDSLDPLLGSTYPDKPWNPRDGRITELGMHVRVDADFGHRVVVGIAASVPTAVPERKIAWRNYGGPVIAKYELPGGTPEGWGIVYPHWGCDEMQLSTDQAIWLRNALDYVLDESRIGRPTSEPKPLWD